MIDIGGDGLCARLGLAHEFVCARQSMPHLCKVCGLLISGQLHPIANGERTSNRTEVGTPMRRKTGTSLGHHVQPPSLLAQDAPALDILRRLWRRLARFA